MEAEEQRKEAVALGDDLKRLKYAHQIGLAQAEWDANNCQTLGGTWRRRI